MNKKTIIGTPLSENATRLLLMGSGELGKEVAIEAMRLGLEVVAVDRYANAPAMQIAHRAHVIDMQDPDSLMRLIELEKPDFLVPEIEAIATKVLVDIEARGANVCPTARAVSLTMNREGIRMLASEELGLPTSPYVFAGTQLECVEAVRKIGVPCIVKPVMSSSGKGQVFLENQSDAALAWNKAVSEGRGNDARVIVEGFIDFDFEITLLTVRHRGGTLFCRPIGHTQVDGDYRESWQPQEMSHEALQKSYQIAENITESLGGWGVFGVELFVKGDEVWFSEVSPRPHDTGLVTLVSQRVSQFALHVRALLGVDLSEVELGGICGASVAILGAGDGKAIGYNGLSDALSVPSSDFRIFGKPEVVGKRRLGVALAADPELGVAKKNANLVAASLKIEIKP